MYNTVRALGANAPCPIQTALGEHIAGERQSMGLTQEQMGAHLGLSQSAYSKIEAGSSAITVSRLLQIAHVLGASFYKVSGPRAWYGDEAGNYSDDLRGERAANGLFQQLMFILSSTNRDRNPEVQLPITGARVQMWRRCDERT